MPPLRVILFGTAELARPSLVALSERPDFDVVAVVTQPDRPKGRDLKLQPPPVKVEAVPRGLPVLQPERARRPEFVAELAQYRPLPSHLGKYCAAHRTVEARKRA